MSPDKKPCKVKFNGRDLDAYEGQLAIDVAREHGIDIPHYCYHPALGNPGNCRMCIVEVAGAPKPMVSCRLPVKEGMDIKSDSEAAKRAQQSSLEFHLVNHPLDCPVCDQSGECGLQDYYMKHGRYESKVRKNKVHKNKRLPVGTHVMLDQERCVLCTRCTRFVAQVTKTHELGIFGRGHTERVDLVPGKQLENAYSGNVVDFCPVGALTDRDFRFQVRVWYLDKADSICPGCSRGCSISVHTSTKRPWHNQGRRMGRLKPRFNAEVNGHWMCDEGRYGQSSLKGIDQARLGKVMRLKPSPLAPEAHAAPRETTWEELVPEVVDALREGVAKHGAKGLAVAASGMLSNEDWDAFKKLFVDTIGVERLYFSPEPDQVGEADDLLRRREKVPNLKHAETLGLKYADWAQLGPAIEKGEVWGLYVIERDLLKILGSRAEAAFRQLKLAVFQGPNKLGGADLVHYRLPATAYVEEEGHFTNFEGRVQKYEQALAPLGLAEPDWRVFERLGAAWSAPARKREAVA